MISAKPTDEKMALAIRLSAAENIIDRLVAAYAPLRPSRKHSEMQYRILRSSEGEDRAELCRQLLEYFETYRPQDIKD